MTARMIQRSCRLAAVVCIGLAGVVAMPMPAGAEAPTESGWWYKAKAGLLGAAPLPPPVPVPDGGLYVANDPSGHVAISAMRFSDDVGNATLLLRVAGTTLAAPGEPPEIVACPATSDWEPVENGAWEDRPEANCDGASTGVLSPDGQEMTWFISESVVADGGIDVVLLPRDGAPSFSITFEAPDEETLMGPGSFDGDFGSDSDFDFDDDFDSGEGFEPSDGGGSSGGDFSFDPGPSPVPSGGGSSGDFSVDPAPPVEVPDDGDDDAIAAPPVPGSGSGTPTAQQAPLTDESRTAQVAAVLTLMAIAGALFWLGSQPVRAPRLLGSLGGSGTAAAAAATTTAEASIISAPSRGIGRFARPRTAPPTRL
ncbi:MAG TPA: hypothetical protein VMN58_08685 [Acidimicrobiales bacterium]|nr:hypothetical protein [Acidimicrobiales bacterium]